MKKNNYNSMDEFSEGTLACANEIALYHYYRNLEENIFFISGEITSDILDSIAIPLLKADEKNFQPIEIKGVNGNGESVYLGQTIPEPKPITIYVNTEGGDAYSGFILCDIISKIKSPTTIHVLSFAGSMGAYILLAGAHNENVHRKCHFFSSALIHDGSNAIQGTNAQIKDYHNFLDKYRKKIKKFVLANSEISEKQYENLERHEWYMTAEEMLEYGLVDEIIE